MPGAGSDCRDVGRLHGGARAPVVAFVDAVGECAGELSTAPTLMAAAACVPTIVDAIAPYSP